MESSLSMTLGQYEDRLRFEAGYGPTGDAEAEIVRRSWQSGLRQFYTPPLVGGVSYNWTFLRPVGEIAIAQGSAANRLPPGFGAFEGPLYVSDGSRVTWPIRLVGSTLGLEAESPGRTGPPLYCEIEPAAGTTAMAGQRWQLRVWPTPDAAYTLVGRFYYHPDALSGSEPYALGGPQHAETIAASCLAAFENMVDRPDGPQDRWPRRMYFMERLAASISIDRRMRPRDLGIVTDPASMPGLRPEAWGGRWGRWGLYAGFTVTFNGQTS